MNVIHDTSDGGRVELDAAAFPTSLLSRAGVGRALI